MNEEVLRINSVTKLFPGVRALNNVSMAFRQSEVHAIVGENGAGKSTLIKILTGAHQPTEGTITIQGEEYPFLEPKQSIDLGITAIYQEFNLVPYLSVAENVFFGNETMNGIFVDKKSMNKQTQELAKSMGIEIDPTTRVKDLGVAYMQIVEIIKAISKDARILIMDEPTAPLTNREIDALFNVVKKLKERGVTVIYISHRLEEIFEICDRVTVMRDGEYIVTKDVSEVKRQDLIKYMVGRDLGETFPGGAGASNDIVFEAVNINTDKLFDISFKLRRGEILGFGGLVGAGRTEVARAIFGADRITSGKTIKDGKEFEVRGPADAIANGISLLPEDRKQQGLVLKMQVGENISYAVLKKNTRKIFLDSVKINEMCEKMREDLRIKTPSLRQLVRNLSGGNQQKVVLAKWLATQSDILIFDEPTRGIDVGAKQEIYNLMNELTVQGKSIIMISSEMPELIGMSDRILVMHNGRIAGELKRSEFDQEQILKIASGM